MRLCADTLKQKTKEYTGDDTDRLGAFKAAAALQHTTPERALAGMLAKHIVSLYDMCFDNSADYGMSTWDEKITDSLNYLFLLKAIVKEGHSNQPEGSKDFELPGDCRGREEHGLCGKAHPAGA